MKNNKYSYSRDGVEFARIYVTKVERTIVNLNDLYVLPTYRNSGVGASILKLAINNNSTYSFELGVRQDNDAAIKLYKKFGFKVEREFEEDGHMFYRMIRPRGKVK